MIRDRERTLERICSAEPRGNDYHPNSPYFVPKFCEDCGCRACICHANLPLDVHLRLQDNGRASGMTERQWWAARRAAGVR